MCSIDFRQISHSELKLYMNIHVQMYGVQAYARKSERG